MNAILAFVLGMLSVVAIVVIVVAVVGYFKARKTETDLKNESNLNDTSHYQLREQINRVENDLHQRINRELEEIYNRISDVEREAHSDLDSRLNKFENKIKINKPEFSDVLTKERLEASKRIMDKID
jgi:hypothetical protein